MHVFHTASVQTTQPVCTSDVVLEAAASPRGSSRQIDASVRSCLGKVPADSARLGLERTASARPRIFPASARVIIKFN
jgi:hypothetical protein